MKKLNVRVRQNHVVKRFGFPDDCDYLVSISDENWLQAACADAIREVQPDLPKQDCGYVNFKDIYGKDGYYDLNAYNDSNYHPGAVQFYSLSFNKYLIQIHCDSGAYNTENVYLLYDESMIPAKARVLEFPSFEFTYDEDSDEPKSVAKVMVKTIGGVDFNPKTKELIVFVKAHGIGDAGRYARYSFANDKPKLEEFRAKFKWSGHGYGTDEILKSPPRTWKRYYPQ